MLEYFKKIEELLKIVSETETNNIMKASHKLADTILEKKSIFAFGASHAGILTQELYYRAGGLVVINPILPSEVMLNVSPITMTSQMERLEGYGQVIANSTDFNEHDVLIVHSVSGRNSIAIDLVLEAKKKGVYVIAITNVSYSKETHSRHSSGLRLFEIADLVIDNHGESGDACCRIEGVSQKVGPTSTVIGATIVNSMVVETVKILKDKGIDTLPIFYSANLDGGDEKNTLIFNEYKDNIKYKL